MAGSESLYDTAAQATTLLEELHRDIPYFHTQTIPAFIVSRSKCVETVGDLKDKINYVITGCSGGRLAGAIAGITGGIAALYGVAMSLTGKGNGDCYIRAGSGISLVGGATSATATLIELGLTEKYMNEVKQILKEDQRLANSVYPMMRRSRTLNLLLMKLFGYSILSENGRTVILVCYECFKIIRSTTRTLDSLIPEIKDSKRITHGTNVINMSVEVARKVVECLQSIRGQPETMESFRKICYMLKENPQVFELAKFSLQMYILSSNFGGLTAMSSLLSMACPATAGGGALLAQGGFHCVMIALNFVTLVFAARDIQTKRSKYCDHLEQIKEALDAELRVVEDLHRAAIVGGV